MPDYVNKILKSRLNGGYIMRIRLLAAVITLFILLQTVMPCMAATMNDAASVSENNYTLSDEASHRTKWLSNPNTVNM